MTAPRLIAAGAALVAAAAIALLVGIPNDSPDRSVPVRVPPTPGDISAYLDAIGTANRAGLRVWIETDLVQRWRAGSASFQQGIDVVAREARLPGVVGVKIADELGYDDGLTSSRDIDGFLDASAAALRAAAPGKKILVDMVVPELGCLPGPSPAEAGPARCDSSARRAYPQLTLDAVGGYLARHDVDVLDLSTGLLSADTYASWGVSQGDAQAAAWREVDRRGWGHLVTLQARKALAHPGSDSDPAPEVAADLDTFVDVPRQLGAVAVDVWTWRQHYEGAIYRLLDPGLRTNALWDGLVARHRAGVRLFTHFSPSSVEVALGTDLHVLATAFTDVFVAAGTG
ncbi:MAG TPA: hypothetical protein VKB69_13695 [Micromonosporaceae bacterium]|nr:hypothetical protein [Micromonosporaceae bacterium]